MPTTYPKTTTRHPASQSGRGVWFVDAVGQYMAKSHCCGSSIPVASRLVNSLGHTEVQCPECGKSHDIRLADWSGLGVFEEDGA